MRIRMPFAGTFFVLVLIAGYAGLTPLHLEAYINDKVLHFLTFFLLTVVFYWIVDTNRRRTLNLTLAVCTAGLGLGSEILQGLLPNDRVFDIYDVAANVLGSLVGIGVCTWYHKRMLERRRALKGYGAVPGEADADLELGEASGSGSGSGAGAGAAEGQEEGVMDNRQSSRTLEEEVDNWDENAVDDWDDGQPEEDATAAGAAFGKGKGKGKANEGGSGDIGDAKRAD